MEVNYTSKYEKFEVKDGDYGVTGNKVSIDGNFQSIECGQVTKEQEFLGTFFAKKTEEGWKVSLYELPIDKTATVVQLIKDIIEEMGDNNAEE